VSVWRPSYFQEKVFDLNDLEMLGRVTVPHEKNVSFGWLDACHAPGIQPS
jgi:hypothetical protein